MDANTNLTDLMRSVDTSPIRAALRNNPQKLAQMRIAELNGYANHTLVGIANFYSSQRVARCNMPHAQLVSLAAGAEILRFNRLEPRNYPWCIVLCDG